MPAIGSSASSPREIWCARRSSASSTAAKVTSRRCGSGCADVSPGHDGEGARKAAGHTAADLMTTPAVTISASASTVRAIQIMDESGVKRLIVVDADGRLEGVVSRRDLLRMYLHAMTTRSGAASWKESRRMPDGTIGTGSSSRSTTAS
ncbi:CBS domain-containing protein [Nonomuraea sp. NPDC049480]|uniref:CBS domain-containing protein n=1 Tax=Nonomuraea sp. NPDC049480 TaxID=3364353 RepID=UPI002E587170|nr:CBS domain-containing protein [Nonomuraea sp.]